MGLGSHVRRLGVRTDVGRLLGAADAALLSSVSEGIPLSLIEAMAAGLPVVATRVGGVPEIVEDGRSGLLVPAGDDEAMAERILRLATNPALGRQLGQAGRERAQALFSEERMTAEYARMYREMTEKKAGDRQRISPGSSPVCHDDLECRNRGLGAALPSHGRQSDPYPEPGIRLAPRHRITFIAHRSDESAEGDPIPARKWYRGGPRRPCEFREIRAPLLRPAGGQPGLPRPYLRRVPQQPGTPPGGSISRPTTSIDVWQVEATVLIDALADLERCPKVVIAHNVESLIWQRYARDRSRPAEALVHQAAVAEIRAVRTPRVRRGDPGGGRERGRRKADPGSVRRPERGCGGQRHRPELLRGGAAGPRPGDDPLSGQPRLAAEPRRGRAAAGPDLPGWCGPPSPRPGFAWSVGSRLRPWSRRSGRPGVELHADVPDVRPFLATSAIMVVPCGSAVDRG